MEVTQQKKLQQTLGCSCSSDETDSYCTLRLIATAEPLVSTQLFFFFKFNNYVDSFSSSKLVYALIFLKITARSNLNDSSKNSEPCPISA